MTTQNANWMHTQFRTDQQLSRRFPDASGRAPEHTRVASEPGVLPSSSLPDGRDTPPPLQRLIDAGFAVGPELTPLAHEVLNNLSVEEVDLLIALKEPLRAAQGGALSLAMDGISGSEHSTASERMRGKLGLVLPLVFAPNQALFSRQRAAELYPAWALTIYQLARNFLPLMETALARARELAGSDPVAAAAAAYLAKHIEDERHGAEGYGEAHLADLAELGVDRAWARRQPLPLTIATLVGCHYDWIIHRHPVALFGFLEVAEGYPPSVEAIENFIARSYLPRAAFNLLFEHADLDVTHRDELHAVVDRLPLTSEQETVLGVSAMRTVDLMGRALWESLGEPAGFGNGYVRPN